MNASHVDDATCRIRAATALVTGAVPRVGPVRLHTKSARQETGIKTVCSAREYAREYRTESGGIYIRLRSQVRVTKIRSRDSGELVRIHAGAE